jgi:hypothetical protein
MRLPFNLPDTKLEEDSRVKFIYTSPELHQNIELSLDGDDTSVETLLNAFERFLGALGICLPPNVILGFVELEEDGDSEEDSEEDKD